MVSKSDKSAPGKKLLTTSADPISDEKIKLYVEMIRAAVDDFEGDLPTLESALGFVFIGHYFGWKVLHILHSKSTVRKYEKILGEIDIKQEFFMNGPLAKRSLGWRLFEKVSNFWKAVNGEIKIEGDKFHASR